MIATTKLFTPGEILVLIAILAAFLSLAVDASGATHGDWAGKVLTERARRDLPTVPSLEVVRQDHLSRLGLGKSVLQTPLCIGDNHYEHGLGTQSISEIVIRLPKPGHLFRAEIGIDNNFSTQGRLGTAVFVVEAHGKELFRSGIMRASDPPAAVKVDLGGAREFILRALDAGDGPDYDEADWANAVVTLEGGQDMQLEEFSVALAPAKFSDDIPFSFIYDGKPSSDLLPNWQQSRVRAVPSPGKQCETVTFTDPATGLEVTCETTTFDDFSAVDWVVYLRNKGSKDTPIIESIRAMDLHITAPNPAPVVGEITFHHSHGSTCTATDFLPIDDLLAPNSGFDLAPVDGRSSDTTLPFFNLEWPGGGVIGAVGWSGQWAMSVHRDAGSGVTLQAGQQSTHLRLHPGEMIRTPRILLSAWRASDPIQGNNRFRRLLLAHYLPRVNGEVVVPPVTQNTWFTYTGNGVNEENQLEMIRTAAAVGVECYWLDAGWFEGGWPNGAGSWVPRTDAFPHGLKVLADAARAKGMKFVLWFEPERVCPGTRIATEHPDWIMHVLPGDETPSGQDLNQNQLFNLGNPDARRWMTDMLSKCIEDWGIGIYRQDFNIFGATYFWKAADAPDRQGMAENQHIQGLYAMWDDLLKRHPGLVIDNCASGGRRIDLELLSRSIPLWRSDTQCVGSPMPIQDQIQTAGLSLYVPLHSASVWTFDPYEWRSVATTGANLCMDHRSPGFDKAGAKRVIREVKELRQLWLGDYYPLAGINADEAQWCGWQFDRPDLGRGFAMYFRRPKCRYIAVEAGLRGLDPKASYEVTLHDAGVKKTMKGEDLAKMTIMIRRAPSSVLLKYKRL